jgi:HSP20 family protein
MAMPGLSDPFSAMLALQRALESRFQSDWMGGGTAGTGAYPPINIFKQGDDFVAVIELPGIDKTELSIEAKENTIRISGKKALNYEENASIHRRERSSGVFDRTISLPLQIEPDGIRAEYHGGLLALFIPRAASEKPRTIQIK